MPIPTKDAEHLTQLINWIGAGVGAGSAIAVGTFVRSLVTNRMSSYEERKKAHLQEIKEKVLLPLQKGITDHLPLFNHEKPVVMERWGRLTYTKTVRPTEDPATHGAILESVNPWTDILERIDRALLEDVKTKHFRQEVSEVLALAESWQLHSARCLKWVGEIAGKVLKESKMNPYAPPYDTPYVQHFRLGVFVCRRLFHLPTERLHKKSEGQYFSVVGAPTVPDVIGAAGLGEEAAVERLLEIVDHIIQDNRENAAQLLSEAKGIRARATILRDRLGLAIASKRLHGRCDLVPFF